MVQPARKIEITHNLSHMTKESFPWVVVVHHTITQSTTLVLTHAELTELVREGQKALES